MDQRTLNLLEDVRDGKIDPQAAYERLRSLPYEDLGFARLDHHRVMRQGFPEVVFGEGKTPEQIAQIMLRLVSRSPRAMATRAAPEAYAAVREVAPDAVYHAEARAIVIDRASAW